MLNTVTPYYKRFVTYNDIWIISIYLPYVTDKQIKQTSTAEFCAGQEGTCIDVHKWTIFPHLILWIVRWEPLYMIEIVRAPYNSKISDSLSGTAVTREIDWKVPRASTKWFASVENSGKQS